MNVIVIATIGLGLVLDQHWARYGQVLVSAAAWLVLAALWAKSDARNRPALMACLLFATAGEVFLSLVWGLYEYRLSNVPLFVPPGHALLFMLGRILAVKARDWIVWFVPLATAPFVFMLAVPGLGTLDALLFALFLLCMLSGRASRLYAVMFVLSLAMEVYGTWLGNWTWAAEAPWLGFTTINPPLAAGAFYCMLDMLVVATVARRRTVPAEYRVPLAAPRLGRPSLVGITPWFRRSGNE